jgi:two-component system capsular synthesis sensor histidine kinase RcsC
MLETQDSTGTDARYDVRILVVDDDALARFIVADQLDALGCACVDTAADGADALPLALARSYDLIVTDLCMPKMGGQALLAALRTHGLSMPVIAGTAWSEPAPACTGAAAPNADADADVPPGFAAVLRKPFSMAQLRGLLVAHVVGWPSGRHGRVPACSPRRALLEAFAAAWPDDEAALRAAFASLDTGTMQARLHRLRGALAVVGDAPARRACAQLQTRLRRHGIEASAAQIEHFLAMCARIGRGA